jgi:hypothetical protein
MTYPREVRLCPCGIVSRTRSTTPLAEGEPVKRPLTTTLAPLTRSIQICPLMSPGPVFFGVMSYT